MMAAISVMERFLPLRLAMIERSSWVRCLWDIYAWIRFLNEGNQSRSVSPDPPYSELLRFRLESKTGYLPKSVFSRNITESSEALGYSDFKRSRHIFLTQL